MLIRREPYIGHQVVISSRAFYEILCYTMLWPKEVAGYGMIRREGMLFYLDEVFILDQTVSSHHAETNVLALGRKMGELAKEDKHTQMRFHWHSHVNFRAYFSATDVDHILGWGGEWLMSLVVNKRADIEIRLDEFAGGRHHTWHVRLLLPPDINRSEAIKVIQHAQNELDKHVRVGNPLTNTGGHVLSLLRRRFR